MVVLTFCSKRKQLTFYLFLFQVIGWIILFESTRKFINVRNNISRII